MKVIIFTFEIIGVFEYNAYIYPEVVIMDNAQQPITLPDTLVTIVSKDGEFSTTLGQYIQDNQLGLILYFYPKDNTQGCSLQAQAFSEHLSSFIQKGYQVLGVSRDSIKSHHNFIDKKSLTIGLISDSDEQLCQHFDVIKEKKMYGKTHLGIVRSTFVFDINKQMITSFYNVKAKDHVSTLLAHL